MNNDTELFRLLMRTAAAARRPLSPVEENAGADRPRPHGRRGYGHILELLSRTEGICQQQIALLAGIRPQSVSEAICALEGRGYVRREAGIEDKRTVLIYLTEAGEAHRAHAALERAQKADRLFAALTEEEKQTLFSLLNKIRNAQKEEL